MKECGAVIFVGENPCKKTVKEGLCDYHKDAIKVAVRKSIYSKILNNE